MTIRCIEFCYSHTPIEQVKEFPWSRTWICIPALLTLPFNEKLRLINTRTQSKGKIENWILPPHSVLVIIIIIIRRRLEQLEPPNYK
jgi:hypothetical protein